MKKDPKYGDSNKTTPQNDENDRDTYVPEFSLFDDKCSPNEEYTEHVNMLTII